MSTRKQHEELKQRYIELEQRHKRIVEMLDELRVRLDALAWQARRNTPPSIKDHADLWVIAIEAMAERAREVRWVADRS